MKQKDSINFNSWKKVNEYNAASDNPVYCKTQLSRLGLKPKNKDIYQIHRVNYNGHWTEYKFFSLSNTVEKRKVSRITNDLAETPANLCEALYIINKSAKKSRDTSQRSYNYNEHSQSRTAKTRKNKLYDLKNKVMQKLIADGIIELVGYHIQKNVFKEKTWYSTCDTCEYYMDSDEDEDENEFCDAYNYCNKRNRWSKIIEKENVNYLLLYKYESFSFHIPGNTKPLNTEYLGDIQELISQEVKIKCVIKYSDAINLLQKYIETV